MFSHTLTGQWGETSQVVMVRVPLVYDYLKRLNDVDDCVSLSALVSNLIPAIVRLPLLVAPPANMPVSILQPWPKNIENIFGRDSLVRFVDMAAPDMLLRLRCSETSGLRPRLFRYYRWLLDTLISWENPANRPDELFYQETNTLHSGVERQSLFLAANCNTNCEDPNKQNEAYVVIEQAILSGLFDIYFEVFFRSANDDRISRTVSWDSWAEILIRHFEAGRPMNQVARLRVEHIGQTHRSSEAEAEDRDDIEALMQKAVDQLAPIRHLPSRFNPGPAGYNPGQLAECSFLPRASELHLRTALGSEIIAEIDYKLAHVILPQNLRHLSSLGNHRLVHHASESSDVSSYEFFELTNIDWEDLRDFPDFQLNVIGRLYRSLVMPRRVMRSDPRQADDYIQLLDSKRLNFSSDLKTTFTHLARMLYRHNLTVNLVEQGLQNCPMFTSQATRDLGESVRGWMEIAARDIKLASAEEDVVVEGLEEDVARLVKDMEDELVHTMLEAYYPDKISLVLAFDSLSNFIRESFIFLRDVDWRSDYRNGFLTKEDKSVVARRLGPSNVLVCLGDYMLEYSSNPAEEAAFSHAEGLARYDKDYPDIEPT